MESVPVPVPDWAALQPDLLGEIAIRVQLLEDFMAFRGVCTSWRAVAGKDRFEVLNKSRAPLLILAEKEDSNDREFYSLSRRKISMRVSLPELKGKRCMEAGFGWLLTISSLSGEVKLLNPFSGKQIEVPNVKNFPEYEYYKCYPEVNFIKRAVLSVNPSECDSKGFVLLVVVCMFMGFWRPGDKNWTRIESRHGAFANITYHRPTRKFYGINYSANIWVWDPAGPDLTVAHMIFNVGYSLVDCRFPYLVESSMGDLLLVTRNDYMVDDDGSYGVTNFGVIRLDVMKGEWEEINSLGKDAIFIGHNASIAVAAAPPCDYIKSNCIYFSDDCVEAYYFPLISEEWGSDSDSDSDSGEEEEDDEEGDTGVGEDGDTKRDTGEGNEKGDTGEEEEGDKKGRGGGKDMGIYDITEQSIERFKFESRSFICPPLWITPSFS